MSLHKSIYSSNISPPSHQRTLSDDNGEIYISEQVIKKSRFVGIAKRCNSWEDAQATIQHIREEHSKSRHVCFGVVLTGGEQQQQQQQQQERSSDDGEP